MAAAPSIPSFTERQLPRAEEIFLDHVAHFVRDQRAAAEAMTSRAALRLRPSRYRPIQGLMALKSPPAPATSPP